MPEATQSPPQGAQPAAQPGGRVDPYRAYNFKLEIQGITQGHFTECSGMEIKVQKLSYREGGAAQVVHALPGPVEYGDICLRYGLTSSRELWDWFMSAVNGKVQRKNVSILLLDSDGITETMRWNLLDAWPARWKGTLLDAMGHEAAIEELCLAYEKFERG
ncbi:MAG TPA: phage tail protein [Anaerolineae bacterium]